MRRPLLLFPAFADISSPLGLAHGSCTLQPIQARLENRWDPRILEFNTISNHPGQPFCREEDMWHPCAIEASAYELILPPRNPTDMRVSVRS